ncbi:MAG TPA: hypothetical protein VJQ81_07130 [Reyranella sp.]|nr:hypothetical protein [Reyranella sp.]
MYRELATAFPLAAFLGMAGMRGKSSKMARKSLCLQTLAIGLLLLSGCDVARSARDDLNRLVSSTSSPAPTKRPTARPASTKPAASASQAASSNQPATTAPTTETAPEPSKDIANAPPVNLIGKSENEVRALFGPPTTVEERAPGKTWRYRKGSCTLDVQLYPDVQTRQFGTLAYEVKSDDNTDEGNRACLAQLRAHGQSGG